MIVQQRHAPCDFEIAAIVPHLAQQRERASPPLPRKLNVKLSQFPAQQAPTRNPVCELPGPRLERRVHSVNHVRIQTDPRHQKKVPRDAAPVAGHVANRDPSRPQFAQAAGRLLQAAAQLHLRRQHVGRTSRQYPQRYRCADHALGRFVDRPVAARHQNQVRPAGNVRACHRPRDVRARGRRRRHAVPFMFEDFHRTLDQCAAAPYDLSRPGVVDQYGVPVGCYGKLPVPLNYR